MVEMWAELLHNNGVPAWVDKGDAQAGGLVPLGPATVMVPASQLEEARQILGPAIVGRRRQRRK
jgi:hypothetical protein